MWIRRFVLLNRAGETQVDAGGAVYAV